MVMYYVEILSQVSQLILPNSGGWNMHLINDIFFTF